MSEWAAVARALISIGASVMLVTHMALLAWVGVHEGFYSPAAVGVVQRLALAILVAALVIWRNEAAE